ncbi:hypothetical protein P4W15_06335 [Morganella morganii]|nr:hypothetical protein [Morganella morganii]
MDNDATIPATATGPLFNCDSELIKLIAGSNHGLVRAEKVTADRLGIYIENRDINELAIQLSDTRQKPSPESPGAGQLGWVTYNIKENTLTATGADAEHPVPLTFSAAQGGTAAILSEKRENVSADPQYAPLRTLYCHVAGVARHRQRPGLFLRRAGGTVP